MNLFILFITFASLASRCSAAQACAAGNVHGSCVSSSQTCLSPSILVSGKISQACPSGVKCCLPENPVIQYINTVQSCTRDCRELVGVLSSKTAGRLTMEWLQHQDYDDINFKVVLGPVDYAWLAYAWSKDMPILSRFPDPLHNGVCAYSPSDVDSGYNFCLKRLAKIQEGTSKFLMRDFEEDADDFNFARALRRNKKAALDAVADRYFSPPGGDRTQHPFPRFLQRAIRRRL
ncbi:hypothetical protein B0T18DRAFT_385117 [Schizothecium vesticola]|uniref:Uncharacterized protein n=1 Tax=Schizothecium vesticola TaxID=314040 RepID=A0AA40F8D8_9PEZI|nr:hypothetical protein B0T18DRAFT_385117 [Schizothecium vesticola]